LPEVGEERMSPDVVEILALAINFMNIDRRIGRKAQGVTVPSQLTTI